MATHDKQGREYLKIANAKVGMKIVCDGGFDCVEQFETVRLNQDSTTGMFYFICAHGRHYIGVHDISDDYVVGLYPFVPTTG